MKDLIKSIILGVGLIVSVPLIAQEQNVLFIAVDDLKPLLGAYGDEMAIAPNIDRLASMGVTFTNNHCQQAVCGPSRASLLTGLRPDLTEVWDLKTMMRDKNPNILTLPQHFKNNGYETVGMGKIFDPRSVDKGLDTRSWTQPYIMPDVNDPKYGEPALASYQSPEIKARYEEVIQEGKSQGLEGGKLNKYVRDNFKPTTESLDIDDEGYFDGMVAKTAVEQLNELSKGDKPFFLAVGFKKPHLPFVAPKKYWDMYQRENMPLAEFQKQAANTIQLPYHSSGELNSYTDIPDSYGNNGLINNDKQRELIHGYYACISYIDAQIGKVLDALEANGLKDNTSIVLWGDHGWHLGDHGLWNKHTNFEQATRSPLIFADPRMKKGEKNASPTEFVDIFPTLCDLAGISKPEQLQGESLKPVLAGDAKEVKEFAVSQYGRAKHMGYALRNERYRYVAWYKDGDTSSEANILFKELYDYKKDPMETNNVVGSSSAIASEMQSQLTNFLSSVKKEKQSFKQGNKTSKGKKTTAQGLIQNSGFESGMDGWKSFGECPIEVVSEIAFDGQSSLRFTGARGGVNQVVKGLKPETTYEVTAFIKTENKEAVVLKVSDFGGEDLKEKVKDAEYTNVVIKFTTGKEDKKAKITIQKYGEGSGKSYVDQVVLREFSPAGASIQGPSIKEVIQSQYGGQLYVGATISSAQLGTSAESILTSQFNYTVPENCAKQSRAHPEPGVWKWEDIDAVVAMAEKNGLTVRLHGPISPQASKWAKADDRTPKELEKIMSEYMIEQCKRFNGHPAIKWMDVVNETVEPDGTWFGPKKGVGQWENPWTIIGTDMDKNQTPIYISRAFELANRYAPDISQVYNHHGGMEPVMWERVKETILYLRAQGLRVDGMGWQAHLRSDKPLAFEQKDLDYLAGLIDWAHAHDLDFHVTEIDYKIWDGEKTEAALQKQADAYANILKVLLSKRSSGVVTYNTWGIVDGTGKHADKFMFMFDEQAQPKPAYFAVREALQHPDQALIKNDKKTVFVDGFETGDFQKSWKQFGEEKPLLAQEGAANGVSCIRMAADKSGMKKTLNLKPNTKYEVEVWMKAPNGLKSVVKVKDFGGEPAVARLVGNGSYQKGSIQFVTGAEASSAEMIISRWDAGGQGVILVDDASLYELNY